MSKLGRVLSLLVAILLISVPHRITAAEMVVTNDEFFLVGKIVQGDFERFRAALKTAPDDLHTINLRSSGGKVHEAIQIGRLIRSLYLDTGAPLSKEAGPYAKQNCSSDPAIIRKKKQCLCASACFLIWAGGVSPFGDHVYLHRISFDKEYYGSLNPQEAAAKYEEGLELVRVYLKEMGVVDKYYERLVKTPSSFVDKLRFLEIMDDFRWGGPPAFQEWLIARCGGLNDPDMKKRMKIQDCWFAELGKLRRDALAKLRAE